MGTEEVREWTPESYPKLIFDILIPGSQGA